MPDYGEYDIRELSNVVEPFIRLAWILLIHIPADSEGKATKLGHMLVEIKINPPYDNMKPPP